MLSKRDKNTVNHMLFVSFFKKQIQRWIRHYHGVMLNHFVTEQIR